jgi:cobalt-zinc-cadmium efflux system outer membrane protein
VHKAYRAGRLAGLGVLVCPLLAAAQPLTLAAARARAERVAPPVVLAEQQRELARAEVAVAGALSNPTATLLTAKETARLTAIVSLPLPIFGQRGKAVAAADADLAVAALERDVARLAARWSATNAWLELWAAQERAQLLALASEDARRLLEIASERMQAGSAPRLDVVRATADRARAEAEATAALGAVAAAAARLQPWLASERGDTLRAAGAPEPPSPPEPAVLAQSAAGHPVLRRDRAQVQAAQAHLALEQRLRVPVPNAEISVEYDDPTNDHKTDVIGGVGFELPVLSLRGGAIARARAQRGWRSSRSPSTTASCARSSPTLITARRPRPSARAHCAAARCPPSRRRAR